MQPFFIGVKMVSWFFGGAFVKGFGLTDSVKAGNAFFLKVWLDHIPLNMYIPTSNPQDEGIDIDSLDDGETVWPFTSFATL